MTVILTRDAIDHLLSVYAEIGPAAARELAPKYGVGSKYVRKLACMHKVKAKPRKLKTRKLKRHPIDTDPRWKWAIERGPVFAP